jgi:hypothetical protein
MILVAPATLVLGLLSSAPPAADGTEVELSYKSYRTWDIVLPAEQFVRVSGGFGITHCKGERFAAKLDGTALEIDTDGDGKVDTTVVGKQDDLGNRSARVTLRGETRDGKPFTYSARLVDTGTGWHFAASGAMVGKIGETRVQLIDQNNNGRYDDFGEDAMIVGRSKFATFLSRVVNVGGELHTLQIAPDGSSLTHAPFQGEVGVLDLRTGLETKGKLLSAIVRSADGDVCFDLARAKEGLRVPSGTYSLHSGKFGLGQASAYVRAGRMASIEVAAGEPTVLDWGGPLQGEFKYVRSGGEVVISPADVTYFGKAGEEYRIWDPVGKSPEFTIKEVKAGTELAKAMFPGSS